MTPNLPEGTPVEPTYTAAEVKVLTEAALRLGRKEALEEAATRCEQDAVYDVAARYHFARIARSLLPREMLGGSEYPPRRDATYPVDGEQPGPVSYEHVHSNGPDARDCTTCEPPEPLVDSDLPPEPQAVREPHRALLCGFRDLTRDDTPSCVKPPHSITEPHEWPVGDNR